MLIEDERLNLQRGVRIYGSRVEGEKAVAARIAEVIREKTAERGRAVLGLATGGSVEGIYAELVRMHREEGLSFEKVISFNLDEYLGLPPQDLQSYRYFMERHLFGKVDISRENTHLPEGGLASDDKIAEHCREYEEKIREAGGIDLQLLGIGRTGHIGFNEPGSSRNSRTRRVRLDELTRQDTVCNFGSLEKVPAEAITMGVGTILEAREILLVAWGEKKAGILNQALRGTVCEQVPASFLQTHPAVSCFLDTSSSFLL